MSSNIERLTAVEAKLEENNKTTYRIFEALYGNGKPGLIADVKELALTAKAHHESHNQRRIDWQWVITGLIAVASVMVAWLKG